MKQNLVILMSLVTILTNAQSKPNAINDLNYRSIEYVGLNEPQESAFNKYLIQLNNDKVYRVISDEMCEKYKKRILDYDNEENTGYPLQIVYKKAINFNGNFLIKFELDNCVGGSIYYRDFAFFTKINNNEIIYNKTLTNDIKDKFYQFVISKFNEGDRLCNSNEYNYIFTNGLNITKVKDNIVYGKYILYGLNAPNCCPEYSGDFEYNLNTNTIEFKNEFHELLTNNDSKENSVEVIDVPEKTNTSKENASPISKSESAKKYDYSRIYFGDESSKVISLITYYANSNSNWRSKVFYNNGKPKELCVYKNNILGLFGTLTLPLDVKERYIFCGNILCEILQEIPALSVQKIKVILEKSNQLKRISNFIFSKDYESVYSVYLNKNQIATIQKLPTRNKKFPKDVQVIIDKALMENDVRSENESKEVIRETKTEEPIIYTSCEKEAVYKGDLIQYLSEHISFPKIDVDKRIEKVTLKAQVIIDENGKVLIGDIDTKFSINGVYDSNDIKDFSNKYASAFENELIKVLLNMPNWTPAQCGGKNSKSKKVIPFTFHVSE